MVGKLLVLINGLPGSGKTTLGRALAPALNARFLSKDAVKEALAGCIGDAEHVPTLGGIAMDAVWALAQETSASAVIDSWWFKPRDLLFAKAGIQTTGADRIAEIWCDVPPTVAKSRYQRRRRAALYRDEQRSANDWDLWAEHATPLGLAPTLFVDTTRPVDCANLAEQIERAASSPW